MSGTAGHGPAFDCDAPEQLLLTMDRRCPPVCSPLRFGPVSCTFVRFASRSFPTSHTENIMLRVLLTPLVLLVAGSILAPAQTVVPGGSVSGIWSAARSPYLVTGDLTIPNGLVLVVEPGVAIRVQGLYRLNIQGRLVAEGTPADSILFTADVPTTGWGGLRFLSTPSTNDSSLLSHCILEYGRAVSGSDRLGGAVLVSGMSKLMIAHCRMSYNMTSGDVTSGGGAIAISNGSPRVTANLLTGNTVAGGHGGAILIGYATSAPVIENNIIAYNTAYGGGGIACAYATPALVNNTITGNSANHGGALDCIDAAPSLLNTILWGNTAPVGAQVHMHGALAHPGFYYCDIQGGIAAFGRDHQPGGTFNGSFVHVLDTEPGLRAQYPDICLLADSSACIGAGADSVYDTPRSRWLVEPALDFAGQRRPDPPGSHSDIGAREHPRSTPVVEVPDEPPPFPSGFALQQPYPNPFNSGVHVGYSLPLKGHVTLRVHDLLGRTIRRLFENELPAGEYTLVWSGEADRGTIVPSGVYVLVLSSGGLTRSTRVVLVR